MLHSRCRTKWSWSSVWYGSSLAHFHFCIRVHGLYGLLCSINKSSSVNIFEINLKGKDQFPVFIVKENSNFFTPIFCNIVNTCFRSGVLPDVLKFASVIPIFKNGDPLSHVITAKFKSGQLSACYGKDEFITDFKIVFTIFHSHSVLIFQRNVDWNSYNEINWIFIHHSQQKGNLHEYFNWFKYRILHD